MTGNRQRPDSSAPGGQRSTRPLTTEDQGTWNRLQWASYGTFRPMAPWEEEESRKELTEWCRGLFAGGRLAAGLEVIPGRAYYGDRLVPWAGIGGVASFPDTRRQGNAFTMLKDTLGFMRDSGCVVSALYPFSFAFYRRLGWEHAADRVSYEVPLSDLPLEKHGRSAGTGAHGGGQAAGAQGTAGTVRLVASCMPGETEEVEEGAVERLNEVYRRWARKHNGMLERDEAWWRRFLLRTRKKQKYAVLWEDSSGRPGGYVIYLMGSAFDPPYELVVREMAADSDAAYRGLLAFLRNQEALYRTVKVTLPASDPFALYLPNPRVKREIGAHHMTRLIDVGAGLETAADPPGSLSGRVALSVEDPVCGWNTGEWLLELDGGAVRVERGSAATPGSGSAAPRVEVGVGTLAQITSGFLTATRAREAGRITASDPKAVETLDAVFGRRSSYLSDYF